MILVFHLNPDAPIRDVQNAAVRAAELGLELVAEPRRCMLWIGYTVNRAATARRFGSVLFAHGIATTTAQA